MRKCGDCQLCCRLLPTEEIGKVANVRCQYQRAHKGCAIYPNRPMSCQLWSCRWLVNDDTHDQQRPDRSHIVLDMIPDLVRITPDDGSAHINMPVIVGWVDPDYPDAWKHPAFQAYLMRQDTIVLLRLSSSESIGAVIPPKVSGKDHLIVQDSRLGRDMPNTLMEKAAALGAELVLSPDNVGPATMTTPDGRAYTVAATRTPMATVIKETK